MKTTFTLGLRGRLILLIVVAFTVIFAMIVQHTIAHRAEEIANATTHLLHNAKLIAARQQQIQTRAEAILNDLMTRAELRSDVSIKSCEKFLAARAKQEAAFLQIGKVLPNGDLACTAHPAAGRVNLADWDWFQSVLKSENMVVSGALTSRSVNQPTVVFAKAVRNDAGQVTSVLFLSLDLSWLRQELSTDGLQEGTRLVAVDSSGIVLVRHPDGDDDRADKSIAQTPLFQAVTAKSYQGTIEERGLDGLPRIVAFTPLLETVSGPMILWLSVPKAVVEASTQRELTTSLSVAATVLLLVIALVIWGGEKLVLFPLRRLLLAVTRFGSGDLSARTGLPRTEDDIGRLAQSFDIMAESVQASEARFRAVAEASLDALFILRSVRGEQGEILDFEFTDLNPRAEQMLDMARDKVVGQKLCELLPVNRTGGFFDKYVAVATTGTPLEEEFPIDIPEIKAKWVRHQVVRVGDGIAISSRDITQWKKMSAEIRRQGKLRKQIMSSVGEGIFGLDTEGRATFVNPAATAMLQWSEKELVGQPMHALHHHTRADGTPYPGKECPIYEAYRDGKVHRVDNEVFWRNDGTSFPVEYVSTPIFDDQGVLTGAVVSFTDISARKQAEQILHDSEERFRVTIENIRDAFVLINGEDERILLWNPAAEEMFGYSQEEIIGQPMHHLIVPPCFHEAAYAGLARFTQTGEGAAVGRTNE
ncbi:MAG: PAS domain S-box protein, partial [Gammaproteobacteria bacterium]|nr:PAS domain S-box protein [Gammaproteobacteria bacterium]